MGLIGFNRTLLFQFFLAVYARLIYNHVDFYPIRILSMTSRYATLQEASCYFRLILYLCMISKNVNKDKNAELKQSD